MQRYIIEGSGKLLPVEDGALCLYRYYESLQRQHTALIAELDGLAHRWDVGRADRDYAKEEPLPASLTDAYDELQAILAKHRSAI